MLAQRFETATQATPLEIYRALRSVNPSPYMFLLDFPDFQLVGASPEVHVRCEDGKVEIRPIAGRDETINIKLEEIRQEDTIIVSHMALGNGIIKDIPLDKHRSGCPGNIPFIR